MNRRLAAIATPAAKDDLTEARRRLTKWRFALVAATVALIAAILAKL